jgi:hypothetical protein
LNSLEISNGNLGPCSVRENTDNFEGEYMVRHGICFQRAQYFEAVGLGNCNVQKSKLWADFLSSFYGLFVSTDRQTLQSVFRHDSTDVSSQAHESLTTSTDLSISMG